MTPAPDPAWAGVLMVCTGNIFRRSTMAARDPPAVEAPARRAWTSSSTAPVSPDEEQGNPIDRRAARASCDAGYAVLTTARARSAPPSFGGVT